MFNWIAENIGTIIVCLILIAIVTAIIIFQVKQKREGKSSCGANCAHCALNGKCHTK
ncbi:MAG: FeoB-associated Cys-rich membrane protein [Clostridia bacterium]|nr:FeoB-associated Cys-rich membrane protein [Clostridia bacterium]